MITINADPNSTLDLPTGPTDVTGKANLLITKYAGSSSDGSGLPGTYSTVPTTINPDDNDIVWNATANRWEYNSIGSTIATNGCNKTFTYKDKHPPGNNYYRIKINDNGAEHYTRSILLQTDKTQVTTLAPNIIKRGESILISLVETEGTLRLMDGTGRQVYSQTLTKGVQSVTLPITQSGAYFYNIQNHAGKLITGKINVQ